MATLEDVLVPIYLYHRYQVAAVAKSIGGLDYSFNLRVARIERRQLYLPPGSEIRFVRFSTLSRRKCSLCPSRCSR